MEIFESSPYVIERAKRMAPYFAKRNWFVTARYAHRRNRFAG